MEIAQIAQWFIFFISVVLLLIESAKNLLHHFFSSVFQFELSLCRSFGLIFCQSRNVILLIFHVNSTGHFFGYVKSKLLYYVLTRHDKFSNQLRCQLQHYKFRFKAKKYLRIKLEGIQDSELNGFSGGKNYNQMKYDGEI